MKKAELRETYLAKRAELGSAAAAAASSRIAERLFSEISVANARTVHCFISIPKFNEIDTSLIFERIWREHPAIRTVAPRINKETDELEHVVYSAETELAESSWGIREPTGDETVEPDEIDLIIVPLVCFDDRGYRVGYGGGYYDRFLKQCRRDALKAGVSYFPPVERISDVHEGDVPVDLCITPGRLVLPR